MPLGSNEQLRSIDANDINAVAITFNQAMHTANTGLQSAHVLQQGDLRMYSIANGTVITASGFNYGSNNVGTWTFPSNLAKGQYYIQLSNAVVDDQLHPLTGGWSNPKSIGDAHLGVGGPAIDGTNASQFSLAITILPGDSDHNNIVGNDNLTALPTGAVPLTNVVGVSFANSSVDAAMRHQYVVQVGSLNQLAVIPLLADIVYIQFSQPMQIGGTNGLGDNSLWLALNSQNGNAVTVVAGSLAWDWKTNTASWHLQSSGGVFGQYAIHVAGTVLDVFGHAIDGDWMAPVANTSTATVSGTGAEGGEFVFAVLLLAGDASGNHTTDFTDLGILLNNFNQAGTFAMGDFNGDGVVDFSDLGILLNWYNISIIS